MKISIKNKNGIIFYGYSHYLIVVINPNDKTLMIENNNSIKICETIEDDNLFNIICKVFSKIDLIKEFKLDLLENKYQIIKKEVKETKVKEDNNKTIVKGYYRT